MRVLTTSLIEYPPLLELIGEKKQNNFCGWLYAFSQSLLEIDSSLKLAIVSIAPTLKNWERYEQGRFIFYRVPSKGLHIITQHEIQMIQEILDDFNPEIIQLNGTEYSLGLEIIKANHQKVPILATIQGLSFVYERYNQGYLSITTFYRNMTFRDLIKMDGQLHSNKIMRKRGEIEKDTINNIKYITGRTFWDKAHVETINPNITYFKCNEILRDTFYTSVKWSYNNCTPYTIFCSNGSMPLKGAHFLIKSIAIVKQKYPNVKLRIIGPNVLDTSFMNQLKLRSYQKYLKKLILKLNLENNIEFLGFISEKMMVEEFLKTNVYVLPSCIENSPNSLCEAQILGVPCISSICGGTPDFITNGKDGYLYRCEEYEILAQLIIKVFEKKSTIEDISRVSIPKATDRHDRTQNATNLINIFKTIINLEK